MLIRKLLLFLLLLISSLKSEAVFNCVDILSSQPKYQINYEPYGSILYTVNPPQIDLDTQTMLMNHSISQLPRKLRQKNIPVQFAIPLGMSKDIISVLKGESIQGYYLNHILNHLFPWTPVATKYLSNEWAESTVTFLLGDNAEYMVPPINPRQNEWLDLNLVKSGNPGLTKPDHETLRRKLGIPSQRTVVSVYLRFANLLNDSAIQTALHDLVADKGFHDIFISTGTPLESNTFQNFIDKIGLNEPLYTLSTVNESSVKKPHRWIYNDTLGLMPQIHAVADLSVVVGPVNFFEPINVKTPTVLFLPHASTMNYDTDVLATLIKVAEATHGLKTVTQLSQWDAAVTEMMYTERTQILVPAHISISGQESPFHQLLSRLEHMICAQLGQGVCD